MCDFTGKALEKFDSDWTTLTAYGGTTCSQFRVRVIKAFWNDKKWKFIFHIQSTQGPVLLGLRTVKQLGIFTQHPVVWIEIVDLCSTQTGQYSQLKEEEMVKPRRGIGKLLSQVHKARETHPPPAEDS